jgi:sensor c-di-GMP phosphodiesterase-like protein
MTESDLVKDPDKAVMYLNQYRQADFTIAIDDFGTGYSSLAYLKKFPVDTLKIDKSFVLNLDTQESDQHIVNTVIDLANSFDLKVVAEGVENQKSLAILKQKGCQWAQGYYICKPIPADMFIKWYGENKETQWLT